MTEFSNATIDLARALVAKQEAGEPIADEQRAELAAALRVHSMPDWLRAAVAESDGWQPMMMFVESDVAWRRVAAMTIALVLSGHIDVPDEIRTRMLDVISLWTPEEDLEALIAGAVPSREVKP